MRPYGYSVHYDEWKEAEWKDFIWCEWRNLNRNEQTRINYLAFLNEANPKTQQTQIRPDISLMLNLIDWKMTFYFTRV